MLITDPAYIRNTTEYQVNIRDHEDDSDSRLFVKVAISQGLFDQIGSLTSHMVASRESDESFYQFGAVKDSLKDYEYVGWHGSDSGMTCITPEDVFENEETVSAVDFTEFSLATLQDPDMESDPDEFPLYRWFGRIPEGASSVRVYACDKDSNGNFNGLLLRSGEDDLIDNES